jgi:hydroxymethylglutaryl-CoA lyase
MKPIKIIECPRDAMQGIKPFIPTQRKVDYIQSLLRVGFDTIDFGSFVSPKAIPQMQDTAQVLAQLDLSQPKVNYSLLLPIHKARQLLRHILKSSIWASRFSISENFQMRNTHKTIAESLVTLAEILNIADSKNKRSRRLPFYGFWQSIWRSLEC